MRDRLGAVPLQLQVPVGEGSQFAGVVDIVTTRVIEWEDEDGDVVVEVSAAAVLQARAAGSLTGCGALATRRRWATTAPS